jgi:hypothetical protein
MLAQTTQALNFYRFNRLEGEAISGMTFGNTT